MRVVYKSPFYIVVFSMFICFSVFATGTEADIFNGWKQLSSGLRGGAGIVQTRIESSDTRDGKSESSTQTASISLKFNEQLRLADVSEVIEGRSRRRAYGQNSQYAFQLEHKPGGWLISKVVRGEDREAKKIIRTLSVIINDGVYPHISDRDNWLPYCVDSIAVEAEQDGKLTCRARDTIKAESVFQKKTYKRLKLVLGDSPFFPVEKLDADVVLNGMSGTEVRTVMTQRAGRTVLPVKSTSNDMYILAGRSISVKSSTEHNIDPSVVPSELEFTLSAFGLPEPQGVSWQRPTPRYLYLIAAAVGLAALSAVFRWLARRRGRRSATPLPA